MRYIPSSQEDVRKMLADIGIASIEELFTSIPSKYQFRGDFSFPKALSEQELSQHLWELSSRNSNMNESASFLGGGSYNHYVPALVDALISRGEFLTSYTPYQPEISQGTLQAIFEFQTFVCQITGLDIANASMYDGASSAAEAVLMARRIKADRNKVLISSAVHPNYRKVIRTYTANLPIDIIELPYDASGRTDAGTLQSALDGNTICVVLQTPNYFGVVEEQEKLFAEARSKGAMAIAVVAEALSLGILKSPGDCGADFAAGECQSLGLHAGYGGPYAGFLSARQAYMRNLPGRLVGMAKDFQDRRGFVLTLAAREQHIRREKATSNICTNQGLCALAVTVYMSFIGGEGFRNLALRNLQTANYARETLSKSAKARFNGPHFNEFVLELKSDAESVVQKLAQKKIFGGIPLGRYYPELKNSLLVCATEMNNKKQIDQFASELGAAQ
ncbi:MAG TPA: aminomethyl-transferring glycine dehydrogenase subunit GcvPA [Acidobacteriota bacterium]|nr:aminomethyl-transferring glycine dehydrogenase subunit GcvPA [Acidobacteriota bacterium]